MIYEKFKQCLNFPKATRIQFEEEGVYKFVDLDSPLQLSQRKLNRLLVMAGSAEKHSLLEKESESDSEDEPT